MFGGDMEGGENVDKLISLNAAIRLIDKFGYTNCRDSRDYEANRRMDKVRMEIQELPAAFDREKVMEELTELRQKEYDDDEEEEELTDGEEIYDTGRSQGRFEAYHRAIQIVKKGGV